jgi:hypothetical protein
MTRVVSLSKGNTQFISTLFVREFKENSGHLPSCYTDFQSNKLTSKFNKLCFVYVHKSKGSRGSSGSIVSDYGLDDRAIGVRSPAGAKNFSSNLFVQTGSGAHPASCTMGTGGPFSGGKARPGRDAYHSPHLVPRS